MPTHTEGRKIALEFASKLMLASKPALSLEKIRAWTGHTSHIVGGKYLTVGFRQEQPRPDAE